MPVHRRSLVVGICLLSLLLVSCGGGGSGGGEAGSGERLAVLSFSHAGRSDTYRDAPLRIDLTTAVRRSSITVGAIQSLNKRDALDLSWGIAKKPHIMGL